MFQPYLRSIIFVSILAFASLLSLCILHPFLWLLINKQTRLNPGSTLYSEWLQPSVPIFIQFYFFNLTNPSEFQSGHKPHIQQLGPYTYYEKRAKFNISHENGSITYKEIKWYYFDPNLSNGNENDTITSVNLAYITIATKLNFMPWPISRVIEQIEEHFHEYLFITKTVNQLLWGYEDELLTFISNHFINISTNIGLFINKNNTLSDYVTINDGNHDNKKIGQIIKYHGNKTLSCWKTLTANMINGTDGSIFHPFINKNEDLYIFASDICRSLQFGFDSIVKINKLPVLKFIPLSDIFKSPKYYEKNKGFCLNWPNCYDDGILDMSSCQSGAPIVISQPHFLNANKSYQNAVDGMYPTDEFNTMIYIEPNTGSIIKAEKKLQINIVVKNDPNFKQLSNLSTTLLPIMFINESVQLNDTLINQLFVILIQTPYIVQIILIFIVTMATIGICSISLVYFYQNRTSFKYTQHIDNIHEDEPNDTTYIENVSEHQITLDNDQQQKDPIA
ncbi:unnamed protein product [Schistosoma rodhaini]|uniref:Scavenger receptor class B member 1 n=1 Tax=Schistosoma rodhaini TaxID=6188 RepID=A0A183RES1_9TREM|nr:unnamed protein product [Schistosoma rodhaini]